jgi:hypothetical protein
LGAGETEEGEEERGEPALTCGARGQREKGRERRASARLGLRGKRRWACLAHAGRRGKAQGGERERVLGWAEGERSGPAGWAPFYSFSFSTLH